MAKRKTPRVTSLKPEAVTPEQLERLQKVVGTVNKMQADLGALEVQKHELLHTYMQLQGVINEMQDAFEKEYGTANISIADGKINYDGASNS